MKIRVSTNSKGCNKANVTKLTFGWQNKWLEPFELAAWVKNGFCWSGTHFSGGKRCQANADGTNAIVFDFDGELSLDDFWTTKIAQQWCAFTYTSHSSTPEVHRFRAIFPFEGPPTESAWQHKCLYTWLELLLSAELGREFKDDCGQKPERLWFGNTDSEIHMNEDAFIPLKIIQAVDIPEEPRFSRSGNEEITDLEIKRCIWLLDHFIEPSQDEEYNEIYVPVTAACAAIGSLIENAWMGWVSRGHHGDKPSNMDARLKWNGLGQNSGPASLFAIAKRQDPNWARALPQHLRFNPGNGFTPDFDVILAQAMAGDLRRKFR